MTIFLLVLLALLLLLLVLLSVPLHYQARFASDSNVTLAARFSWSRLVVASYDITEGLRVTVVGFKVSLEQGSRKPKTQGKRPATKKQERKKSGDRIPIRPLLSIARRVLRHIKPQRLEGDLRIGFEDPYHTAIMGMVVQWLPLADKVRVIPVYDEEVVEGWFLVEGRVIPLSLLVIALRGFAPIFLRNIHSKFRLSGRKVEKHV